MKRYRLIGAAVVLSLAALAFSQDGFKLWRKAKEGSTSNFKLEAKIVFEGTDVTFTANIAEKVTKVKSDGNYIVESTQSNGKVIFGGQEMDAPSGGASSSEFKPNGELVAITGEDSSQEAYRMAALNALVFKTESVKEGEKWEVEVKATKNNGEIGGKANYEVIGSEKIGSTECIKIKVSYKEATGSSPASSEGTVWVNKADGDLVKAVSDVKNAPVPGAPGPISGQFTVTRV